MKRLILLFLWLPFLNGCLFQRLQEAHERRARAAAVSWGQGGTFALPSADTFQGSYRDQVKSFMGRTQLDLTRECGVPRTVYEVSGHKFLVYLNSRSYTEERRSVTFFSPGPFNMATSMNTGGETLKFYCSTTFEVDPTGNVVGWKFDGNDCDE